MSDKTEGVGRLNVATPGRREARREPTSAEHEAEIDAANSVGKRNGEWVILTAEEQDLLRDGPDRRLSEPQPSRQDPKALMEFLLGRISKHASHDQKTHGNWARGGKAKVGNLILADYEKPHPDAWPWEAPKAAISERFGKEVADAVKWGLSTWTGDHGNPRYVREAIERGEEKALLFLDTVRTQSIPAPVLRRWMGGRRADELAESVEVGDVLEHNYASSFTDRDYTYAGGGSSVQLTLTGGEGLPVGPLKRWMAPDEGEWLVAHPMVVTGVRQEHQQDYERGLVTVIEVSPAPEVSKAGRVWDLTDLIDFNLHTVDPDELEKHSGGEAHGGSGDQSSHGNWARGTGFFDQHGNPAGLDEASHYVSDDSVEFSVEAGRWTIQGGNAATLKLMMDEVIRDYVYEQTDSTRSKSDSLVVREQKTEKRIEQLAEAYLRYDERRQRLEQQLQMADELLGRASLNDQGGVDALNRDHLLTTIERSLNISERVAFNEMSEGAKEHTLDMMARRYAKSLQGGRMSMRVRPDDLEAVLFGVNGPDGEFLNQHETGDSNGWYGPDRRAEVELAQGVPMLTDGDDRPKYGYIENTNWPEKVAQYGDVIVRFDPDIADRTTVTFGDSLNSSLAGVRLSDLRDGSASTERVVASAESSTHRKMWTDADHYWVGPHYVEAQYHGRLSLSNVEEVVYTDNMQHVDHEQLNYIVQSLRDQGITVKARDFEDQEFPISGIREPVDADDDGWVLEGTDEERRG